MLINHIERIEFDMDEVRRGTLIYAKHRNSSFAISNRISTIASAIRSGSMTSEDFCNSLSGHGSCYSCKFYLDSKFLFL